MKKWWPVSMAGWYDKSQTTYNYVHLLMHLLLCIRRMQFFLVNGIIIWTNSYCGQVNLECLMLHFVKMVK